MEYNILGILVRNPEIVGDKLQNLLSLYGCVIRNRLGLNRDEVDGGIIILDLAGDQKQMDLLIEELRELEGIDFKHTKL